MREERYLLAEATMPYSAKECEYILAVINHPDPMRRCVAAIQGLGLDVLKNDEVWLVRHIAMRELRKLELKERGVALSDDGVEYADVRIDDMVYELYKVDWMNENTTPETRMQATRNWCNTVVQSLGREWLPCSLDYMLESKGYPVGGAPRRGFYDSFYSFLGFGKPNFMGVYQDREYVANLLGHDEKLLALYDADINDDYKHQIALDGVLANAQERSDASTNQNGNTKVKPQTTVEPIR